MKVPKTKGITTIDPLTPGMIRIHHHQTIRQNLNYSSAEVSYGVSTDTVDDVKNIRKTVARLEKIVETAMLPKFKEQGRLLVNLAGKSLPS